MFRRTSSTFKSDFASNGVIEADYKGGQVKNAEGAGGAGGVGRWIHSDYTIPPYTNITFTKTGSKGEILF